MSNEAEQISITIGAEGSASTVVSLDKTAVEVGSGSLQVYASPMMAALAEAAAIHALAPFIPEGVTTVGTWLQLEHTAPTPIGLTVTAEARVTAYDGRRIDFEIALRDDREPVGFARHSRRLVDRERFLNRVERKLRGELD
jgi:fluoroacetyl-CoA thioesterase